MSRIKIETGNFYRTEDGSIVRVDEQITRGGLKGQFRCAVSLKLGTVPQTEFEPAYLFQENGQSFPVGLSITDQVCPCCYEPVVNPTFCYECEEVLRPKIEVQEV